MDNILLHIHTYIHAIKQTGTVRLPPHILEEEEPEGEAPGAGRPAIHHVEERVDHYGALSSKGAGLLHVQQHGPPA